MTRSARLMAIVAASTALAIAHVEAQTKPTTAPAAAADKSSANPQVLMKTSLGDITIELDIKKAPISVANFLQYTDDKFYDGTIFHRTIANFMIQGGGFDTKRVQKPTREPIKNEAGNGLNNVLGTLAMARTGVVDSATAQFFINVKDNAFLDHKDETQRGFGYCVFGKVVKGMDVVEKIKTAKVKAQGSPGALSEAEPEELIVIESVRRIEEKSK